MSLPPTERLTPEQEDKEHEYVYLEQLGMGATAKQAKVSADRHIMALRKQWRKEQDERGTTNGTGASKAGSGGT